ncbi:MAG TPA: four helix bundle protein [Verrucomicrobiae bacterium]|nr:four helix bundle protein [Verrucomicrobiae bacterium]
MAIIRSFRDLKVYQQSREQAARIFKLTQSFPQEERYSLTNQIRRSSRAVKSMIAEAWAHRRYPASFVSKMTDALGEATETQSWLDDALDCGYISAGQHREHDDIWQSLGGMINNTIERADDFCRVASK